MYAALVHEGLISPAVAEAVISSDREPIDLEAALAMVCDAIHEERDDEAIKDMLEPEHEHDDLPPHWFMRAFHVWYGDE